jgi:hypothetical protein
MGGDNATRSHEMADGGGCRRDCALQLQLTVVTASERRDHSPKLVVENRCDGRFEIQDATASPRVASW